MGKKLLKVLLVIVIVIAVAAGGFVGFLSLTEYKPAAVEYIDAPTRGEPETPGDSVRIRTSWPRASSSRRRFFTEVTTPFTAGAYQSVVMRIFMAVPPSLSLSLLRSAWANFFISRKIPSL